MEIKESWLKKKIADREYWENVSYEFHKRGKNWIAKLKGLGGKYKFIREFLSFKTIDGKKYVVLEEGKIYHYKNIYYSGGGNPDVISGGIFQIVNGEIEELTEIQVMEIMKEWKFRKMKEEFKINPLEKFSNKEILEEVKRRGLSI